MRQRIYMWWFLDTVVMFALAGVAVLGYVAMGTP